MDKHNNISEYINTIRDSLSHKKFFFKVHHFDQLSKVTQDYFQFIRYKCMVQIYVRTFINQAIYHYRTYTIIFFL